MPNKGKLATQRETYEERESDEDKSESEGEVIEVEILITQLAAILRNHRREQCSPRRQIYQRRWSMRRNRTMGATNQSPRRSTQEQGVPKYSTSGSTTWTATWSNVMCNPEHGWT